MICDLADDIGRPAVLLGVHTHGPLLISCGCVVRAFENSVIHLLPIEHGAVR